MGSLLDKPSTIIIVQRSVVILCYTLLAAFLLRLPFQWLLTIVDGYNFGIAFAQPFRPLAWLVNCDFGTADYTCTKEDGWKVMGLFLSTLVAFFTYLFLFAVTITICEIAWEESGKTKAKVVEKEADDSNSGAHHG